MLRKLTSRRRFLLASVAIAATLMVAPSLARFPRGVYPAALTFNANPLVTVTAINTTGGIVCSRNLAPATAGKAPLVAGFSASAMLATATSQMSTIAFDPWQDLQFDWDFGDPTGTETFVRPTDGVTVNANRQRGAEATYLYRNANTYTVTLTITGANGGGFTTTQVTTQIIVAADNTNQVYVDSNAPLSGADGTIGHPWKTLLQFEAALAANTTVNVACGSSWTGSGAIIGLLTIPQGANNLRIRTYVASSGTAPPQLIATGSGQPTLFLWNNTNANNTDDIVVSGLYFEQNGTGSQGAFGLSIVPAGGYTISNVTLDHCDFYLRPDISAGVMGTAAETGGLFNKFTMWGGSVKNPTTNLLNGIGYFGGPDTWGAFYGVTFEGAGTGIVYDHHMYTNIQQHSVYKWMVFKPSPARGFGINGNWDSDAGRLDFTTLSIVKWMLVSECDFGGPAYGVDLGNNLNTPTTTQFDTVVIEGCSWHDLQTGQMLQWACATSVTVRNNRAWSLPEGYWYAPVPVGPVYSGKVYNNKFYYGPSTAGNGPVMSMTGTASDFWSFTTGSNIITGPILASFTASIAGETFTASFSGTVMTVSGASGSTIAVGQIINGPAVEGTPSRGGTVTRITSFGTGSGGNGTYNISQSQPSVSGSITCTSHTMAISSTITGANNGVIATPYPLFDMTLNLNSNSLINFGWSSSFTATIASNVMTVSGFSGSPLAVGDFIFGGTTTGGVTRIVSFGTGTGGNGTYNITATANNAGSVSYFTQGGSWAVTPAQNVASETMQQGGINIYPVDTMIQFTASAPPAPFALFTNYWIVSRSRPGQTMRLSATKGGSPITVSGSNTTGIRSQTQWSDKAHVFYNNQIQDMRTSGLFFIINSFSLFGTGSAPKNNSLINNNQYYGPNYTGWGAHTSVLWGDFDPAATAFRNWTTWQTATFDAAGVLSAAGFGWTTPVLAWADMGP